MPATNYELHKKFYELTGLNPNPENPWTNLGHPIYTSDYLLGVLPRTVKDVMNEDAYLVLYPKGKAWRADYIGMFMQEVADTPLEALLKLGIVLAEKGLLVDIKATSNNK